MSTVQSGIRSQLQELQLLDLRKSTTISQIVDGLSRCSFGGRMLGEVTATIESWIKAGRRPVIICEYKFGKPWPEGLKDFAGWMGTTVFTPNQFAKLNGWRQASCPIIIIGHISREFWTSIWNYPHEMVFINSCGWARPGQIRDGYFPNAVFADPAFVLPVMHAALRERLSAEQKPVTASQLMREIQGHGGLGQEVAHGYSVLKNMVDDPDCTVFLTMSGAMTIAKMGLVICDLIDHGMVQYIASTGALIAHGLVESVGLKHFKHDPRFTDEQLGDEKLNRVTDTLEPEENLDQVATIIGHILDQFSGREPISPIIMNAAIGQYLAKLYPDQRGILKSAFERKVPVAIPAFVDSEVGNDVFVHNRARQQDGRPKLLMDLELDSQVLMDTFVRAKRRGIFSIGGGVPRNNTQNIAPLIEIANARLGTNIPEATYDTGCRICPDPMWYGHLSGCTYSENASWRKMDPRAIAAGQFAEVHADATMTLPFIIRAIMDDRLK